MRRSPTFWLMGLVLVAGCAAGTEGPPGSEIGTATPSGATDTPDSGAVVSNNDSGAASPPLSFDSGSTTPPSSPKTPYDAGSTSSHDAGASTPHDSGSPEDAGSSSEDSGSGGDETVCKGYAPPDVTAGCTACSTPPCQANGCYGGYWCEMSKDSCHEDPPSGCTK
jgi:hypothetical protein